jgi:hypothetical protein
VRFKTGTTLVEFLRDAASDASSILAPNRAGVSAHALPAGGCRASVREVRLSAGVTKQFDSRSAWNRAPQLDVPVNIDLPVSTGP